LGGGAWRGDLGHLQQDSTRSYDCRVHGCNVLCTMTDGRDSRIPFLIETAGWMRLIGTDGTAHSQVLKRLFRNLKSKLEGTVWS
jgi:hypothetical protein